MYVFEMVFIERRLTWFAIDAEVYIGPWGGAIVPPCLTNIESPLYFHLQWASIDSLFRSFASRSGSLSVAAGSGPFLFSVCLFGCDPGLEGWESLYSGASGWYEGLGPVG